MAYFGCNHAQALNYQVNPTAEPLETCGGANPDSTGLCGLFLLYDPFSSMGLDCNDEGDCSQLTGDYTFPLYQYPTVDISADNAIANKVNPVTNPISN